MKYKQIRIFLMVSVITFFISGCGKDELVVAEQFGLAYAPIEIMRSQGFLDAALKEAGVADLEIKWVRMSNTAAIREAMLADQLDIGFMAIPPFLIGKENGMDWRIMSGVSESPLGLVGNNSALESLDDIQEDDRIILPQPGSVQHILLAMYAERIYGDAEKFDDQLMTLSHPDGMTAMLSGDTHHLHFTSPPYLQQELNKEGFHEILDGETCFDDAFTFIVAVCPERVYEDETVYEAFMAALKDSMAFIEENPEATYAILAATYDYTEAELADYMADPQMKFTTHVSGVERFQDFMVRTGYLKQATEAKMLYWETYE